MIGHLEEIKERVLKENGWKLKKRPVRKYPQDCPFYVKGKPNAFCKAMHGEIAGPGGPKSWQGGTLGRICASADSLTLCHCKLHFLDCGWYQRTFKLTQRAEQFIGEVIDICLQEIPEFSLNCEDLFIEELLKKELINDYEIIEELARREEIEGAGEEKNEDLDYLRRWPTHRVRFEPVAGPSR